MSVKVLALCLAQGVLSSENVPIRATLHLLSRVIRERHVHQPADASIACDRAWQKNACPAGFLCPSTTVG